MSFMDIAARRASYRERNKRNSEDFQKLDMLRPSENEATLLHFEQLFNEFEALRERRLVLSFLLGLVTLGVAVVINFNYPDPRIAISREAGIILILGGMLSYLPIKLLRMEFKDRLVPEILKQYGFTYDQNAADVLLSKYEDVLPIHDRSELSDHFWGEHNGIQMSVAEVRLKVEVYKYYATVFDGLLCRFDYPKKTSTQIAIQSRHSIASDVFNSVFKSSDRVKLEDSVFEATFDVFSTNQVAARYILTPMVMERLIALEQLHNGLRVIFRDSEVLLAIPDGSDLFNPGKFILPLDRGMVQQFHKDVTIMYSLHEALNLDAKTKA